MLCTCIFLIPDSAGKGSLQWTGQHTLHAHLSSVRTVATTQSTINTPTLEKGTEHSQPEYSVSGQTRFSADHKGSQTPQRCDPVSTMVFSAGGRAQIQAWRVTVADSGCSSEQSHNPQAVVQKHDSSEQSQNPQAEVQERESLEQSHNSQADVQKHGSSELSHNLQTDVQKRDSQRDGEMETKHAISQKTVSSALSMQDRKQNMSSVHSSHAGDCPGSSVEDYVVTGLSCSGKDSLHSKSERNSFIISYEHLGGCFLGESRHKRSHKPWKTRYLKLDPETRVMCLAAVAAQQLDHRLLPHLHLLVAAGSDGILRCVCV